MTRNLITPDSPQRPNARHWLWRFVRAVRRQLDKWPSRPGGSVGHQNTHGKWRVIYPDGMRSQRFFHDTARSYQRMFGGRVMHVEDEAPSCPNSDSAKDSR